MSRFRKLRQIGQPRSTLLGIAKSLSSKFSARRLCEAVIGLLIIVGSAVLLVSWHWLFPAPPLVQVPSAERIIAETAEGRRLEILLDKNDPIGSAYKGWDWIENNSGRGWLYVPENSLGGGRTRVLTRRGTKDANVWIKPWLCLTNSEDPHCMIPKQNALSSD